MAKAPGEALPPEIVPCKEFVMSDQFRDWAVSAMRKEVMGQVSKAGLDRMAILKDGHVGKEPSNGAQSHHSKNK